MSELLSDEEVREIFKSPFVARRYFKFERESKGIMKRGITRKENIIFFCRFHCGWGRRKIARNVRKISEYQVSKFFRKIKAPEGALPKAKSTAEIH